MFILKWFLIPLAVVVAGAIGAGQMDFFQSLTPTDLGVRSGKLKLTSGTDNSVSSPAALYPDHPDTWLHKSRRYHFGVTVQRPSPGSNP